MNQKSILDMVGTQKINLYMIMRNLMDIKYYIPIRLKLDLFLTMNGKSLLNMMGIIDPNYGYQTDGILLKKNNINKPMYWIDDKYQFCLTGLERIDNSQPVSHINFYEADAYCKFKKKKECQQNSRWNFFTRK